MMHYKSVGILALGALGVLISNALAVDNVKTKMKYGAERLRRFPQHHPTIYALV